MPERTPALDLPENDPNAPTAPRDADLPMARNRTPNALARANAADVAARVVAAPFANSDTSAVRNARREALRMLRILCVSTAAREGAPEAVGAVRGVIPALFRAMASPELFDDAVYACEEILAASGASAALALAPCAASLRRLIVRLSPSKLAVLCRVLALCVVEPDAPAPGITLWGDAEVDDDDSEANTMASDGGGEDGGDGAVGNHRQGAMAPAPPPPPPPPLPPSLQSAGTHKPGRCRTGR